MTIEQFKNKYKGQNLDIKNFDVLYKIGVDYKTSISVKDKNHFTWKDLTAFLGIDFMTGEQYRLWVVNQQRKDGTLSFRGTDEKVVPADVTPVIDKEKYKATTRIRDEMNLYRKSLRDEARIESLKQLIQDTAAQYPDLPMVVPYEGRPTSSGVEAVLCLSDWHLGVDCKNFVNTYNLEIAAKRLSKVVVDTVKYCKAHRVERLHILNLGDLFNNGIHTTMRVQQGQDAVTQMMLAAELMAETVNQLKAAAKFVTYRSCSDNHSRTQPDKTQNIEIENMNRVIDWFVESRVKGVIFAHDNIDVSMGAFRLMNGRKVMFAHGHLDNPNVAFQHFIGITREWVDYVFLAHQHQGKQKDFNSLTVFVNGSLVGTEEYAFDKRLSSKALQKLVIFDTNNNFIDCSIDVSDIKE